MKTLDEVEPSVPIGPLTTPGNADAAFVINQPGAYHLTGDLVGEVGKHGILITTDDVTLDLRGFTVEGPLNGQGEIAGRSGVTVGPLFQEERAVVRNGRVKNWLEHGVRLGSRSVIEDLTVRFTLLTGASVVSGRIERCHVNNAQDGIAAGSASLVADCLVETVTRDGFNIGARSVVERCVAQFAAEDGFDVSISATLVDCTASGSGSRSFHVSAGATMTRCRGDDQEGALGSLIAGGARIRDCAFDMVDVRTGSVVIDTTFQSLIGDDDVRVEGCRSDNADGPAIALGADAIVRNCVISRPGEYGVVATVNAIIENCTINAAGFGGIQVGDQAVISDCIIDTPAGMGILAGNSVMVVGCNIRETGGDAIKAGVTANIERCTIRGAGVNGIDVGSSSRVASCVVNATQSDGILATDLCEIVGNRVDFGGQAQGVVAAGIHVILGGARVDGNSVSRFDIGYDIDGTGNLIINNWSFATPSGAFVITSPGNNTVGPVLNPATITSSPHPQANFAQ